MPGAVYPSDKGRYGYRLYLLLCGVALLVVGFVLSGIAGDATQSALMTAAASVSAAGMFLVPIGAALIFLRRRSIRAEEAIEKERREAYGIPEEMALSLDIDSIRSTLVERVDPVCPRCGTLNQKTNVYCKGCGSVMLAQPGYMEQKIRGKYLLLSIALATLVVCSSAASMIQLQLSNPGSAAKSIVYLFSLLSAAALLAYVVLLSETGSMLAFTWKDWIVAYLLVLVPLFSFLYVTVKVRRALEHFSGSDIAIYRKLGMYKPGGFREIDRSNALLTVKAFDNGKAYGWNPQRRLHILQRINKIDPANHRAKYYLSKEYLANRKVGLALKELDGAIVMAPEIVEYQNFRNTIVRLINDAESTAARALQSLTPIRTGSGSAVSQPGAPSGGQGASIVASGPMVTTGGLPCMIRRDILIDGRLAFEEGEDALIEHISHDPSRPEYRYVILSKPLGLRFRLSDVDISFQ